MISVGIDPGTGSFDVVALSDGKLIHESSHPSNFVADSPEEVVDLIASFDPDIVIGPSGYGIPLKHISQITPLDRFCMTLVQKGESIPVLVGVTRLVEIMERTGMNVWFIPGVKHLTTVPDHRKINRIDMGTADKVAIALLALEIESRRSSLNYCELNFILVELGYGYNAAIAIRSGCIVDGIGGTMFPGPANMNMGALDGEIAYLLGDFSKNVLFTGGVSTICGGAVPPEKIRKIASHPSFPIALQAFAEGVLKASLSLMPSAGSKRVILSGRLSRVRSYRDAVVHLLEEHGFEVIMLKGLAHSAKEAAQGQAMIGDGLMGGTFSALVEHMKISSSAMCLLDHIYIPLSIWR